MTNREREFASLGFEHSANIEFCHCVQLKSGREVRKVNGLWEAQPPNDNYWKAFTDILDAIKFAKGIKE